MNDLKERLAAARLFRADRMVEMPEALRDEALARIEQLEAKLTEAVETLRWYGDPISHIPTQTRHPQTAASGDGGKRARATLAKLDVGYD
jgi:hypothetical protein